MKLSDYLDQLCWSQADLARAAGISSQSVQRAIAGQRLTRRSAAAIVQALGLALEKPKLQVADISDLRIAPLRGKRKTTKAAGAAPANSPAPVRKKLQAEQS